MTESEKRWFKEMVRIYYPEKFKELHPDEVQAEQESKVYVEKLPLSALKKKAKEKGIKYFNAMEKDEVILALSLKGDNDEEGLSKLVEDVKQRYVEKRGDYFKSLKQKKR